MRCARCGGSTGPMDCSTGLHRDDTLRRVGLDLCGHCQDVIVNTLGPEIRDAVQNVIDRT